MLIVEKWECGGILTGKALAWLKSGLVCLLSQSVTEAPMVTAWQHMDATFFAAHDDVTECGIMILKALTRI